MSMTKKAAKEKKASLLKLQREIFGKYDCQAESND
jgi:hypothetical protein